MNAFDLLVLTALLITAYGGFKNGFFQTVFKTIGYIAGGVAGVAIAVQVMSTWSNNLTKAFKVLPQNTSQLLHKVELWIEMRLYVCE